MAAVTHTNLAVVYGIEIWQDTPFLVQEYLAGGTLAQRLGKSRAAPADALKLCITLAEMLHYMHARGVIHCDIKPSNIGFTDQGTVKLLDFGLARVLRSVHLAGPDSTTVGPPGAVARPRVIAGTPQFMSPEAALGEPASPLVDLWALCVVLYQSLTGRYPFAGPDAAAILARVVDGRPPDISTDCPDLPAAFGAFFERAFASNPSRRHADGRALASDLAHLLS
jgi:eukaryotic-like serine/threonine-protein kinase